MRSKPRVDLSYSRWLLGGIVPGLIALAVVPQILYRIFPPQIKHTPAAAEMARTELRAMGPMKRHEWILLTVFVMVAALWMIRGLGGFLPQTPAAGSSPFLTALNYLARLDYSIPPLLGVCTLLLSGVLDWEDIITERSAWDVFLWYGGLVRMAEALGETGITKRFAGNGRQLYQGMAMVAGPGGISAGLFLCALWICQHHRARHFDVHSVPGGDHRRRSAGLSGCSAAGLLLKPVRVADALRNDLSANLFWLRLCEPEKVVARWFVNVRAEHTRVVDSRFALVETAWLVVVCISYRSVTTLITSSTHVLETSNKVA